MSTPQKNKLYGWFSLKQKEHIHTMNIQCSRKNMISCIYIDVNNIEVEVTEVTHDKTPLSNFNDLIYVGELLKWKKSLFMYNYK
jgi:hypothetical protein